MNTQSPREDAHSTQSGGTPRCCRCVSNPCRTCRCVKQGKPCTTCRFGDNCPNSTVILRKTDDIATEISILKRSGRVLPHIPRGARIAVADQLARLINGAVSEGTEETWRKLMRFAYSALRIRGEAAKPVKASLATQVRLNLTQNEKLREKELSAPTKRRRGSHPADEMATMSRRVASKLADCDTRGALRALTSDDSFAPPTDDIIKRLHEKHPEPPLTCATSQHPTTTLYP